MPDSWPFLPLSRVDQGPPSAFFCVKCVSVVDFQRAQPPGRIPCPPSPLSTPKNHAFRGDCSRQTHREAPQTAALAFPDYVWVCCRVQSNPPSLSTSELEHPHCFEAVESSSDDRAGGAHAWSDGRISHLLCLFRCFEAQTPHGDA